MKVLNSVEDVDRFIRDNKIAILYFSSKACLVCTELLPKIEEMLKKYTKINSAKVEVDELQSVVGEFSIFTLPCILLFIEGKETIREARFISVIELEKELQRFYNLIY